MRMNCGRCAMRSLRNLQETMAAELLRPEQPGMASYVRVNRMSGARRLRVYRNNVRTNLINALRATYPVVCRLVGDDFFRAAASQFLRDHPSTSGNLNDYGIAFPYFLAHHPVAGELPYLSDVAALELALQECANAPEPMAADLAGLSLLPRGRLGEFRLRLHPAVRLFYSRHAVLGIWRANQPDRDGAVVLSRNTPERILLTRDNSGCQLELVPEDEFIFLNALVAGHAVRCAADLALRCSPDFKVNRALDRFLARRTITAHYP